MVQDFLKEPSPYAAARGVERLGQVVKADPVGGWRARQPSSRVSRTFEGLGEPRSSSFLAADGVALHPLGFVEVRCPSASVHTEGGDAGCVPR